MKRLIQKRAVSLLLCLALMQAVICVPVLGSTDSSQNLLLVQAQQMALSNSEDTQKVYNEILLDQIKYEEAVKNVKAKLKDTASYRWSPLLNFKLPDKMKLSQEFDLNVKPQELQTEIITQKHKMDNLKYTVLDTVNQSYLRVYTSSEKADFALGQLTEAKQKLEQSRALLLTGKSTEEEIAALEQSVESLTSGYALQKRSFEAAKQDLSDLIHLDVTDGYTFSSPLKDSDVPRSQLEVFTQYAVDNDQTCYEAKMAASTALLKVNTYELLMRKQYGSKIDVIQNFLNMAKQGQEVDYSAFQAKYKEMLNTIDQPWSGSMNVLTLSIPKEWSKGENSGTRYLQDNLYALLTACKEYSAAITEQKSKEKSLKKQIAADFEALVTARNTYLTSQKALGTTLTEFDRYTELNRMGKATESELQEKKNSYQAQQMDSVDTLSAYDQALFDFDKLTCGAVTSYLNGRNFADGSSSQGNLLDTPGYYIYTDISNLMFVFGLTIPENYEPKITQYEIWYNNVQIGERTSVKQQLRHLALDYQESNKLTVRLYDNDSFVQECEIDTTVPKDVLPIQKSQPQAVNKELNAGSYSVETEPIGKVNKSTLSLKINADLEVKYYQMSDASGTKIYTKDLIGADQNFTYLTLLIASLGTVKLTLFNSQRQAVYNARFDEKTQTILATKSQG